MKENISNKENIVGVLPAKDDVMAQGLSGDELTGEYPEISALVDKLFA
jgi:CO dehydrogenase nickel-insertion accessory protein CooC1